jgi:DNA-directed RNA polymerase specialized sigma24 family protein
VSVHTLTSSPTEQVAQVAVAKRDVLLRVYHGRLAFEDLEDCYSQATLEILQRAQRPGRFESDFHIANALEQKFVSRITDYRRSISGRSHAETMRAQARPLEEPSGALEIPDTRANVEDHVIARALLASVVASAPGLSRDQRLVLAYQVSESGSPAQFRDRHGWSAEKYRKVAQRARTRLRRLLAQAELPEAA